MGLGKRPTTQCRQDQGSPCGTPGEASSGHGGQWTSFQWPGLLSVTSAISCGLTRSIRQPRRQMAIAVQKKPKLRLKLSYRHALSPKPFPRKREVGSLPASVARIGPFPNIPLGSSRLHDPSLIREIPDKRLPIPRIHAPRTDFQDPDTSSLGPHCDHLLH